MSRTAIQKSGGRGHQPLRSAPVLGRSNARTSKSLSQVPIYTIIVVVVLLLLSALSWLRKPASDLPFSQAHTTTAGNQ